MLRRNFLKMLGVSPLLNFLPDASPGIKSEDSCYIEVGNTWTGNLNYSPTPLVAMLEASRGKRIVFEENKIRLTDWKECY